MAKEENERRSGPSRKVASDPDMVNWSNKKWCEYAREQDPTANYETVLEIAKTNGIDLKESSIRNTFSGLFGKKRGTASTSSSSSGSSSEPTLADFRKAKELCKTLDMEPAKLIEIVEVLAKTDAKNLLACLKEMLEE
jgi:hypothetical protein